MQWVRNPADHLKALKTTVLAIVQQVGQIGRILTFGNLFLMWSNF
jgi:hypothetical protein